MPLINGCFTPLELPPKHAKVLLDNTRDWRYRCLHGGRNGAKDWSAHAVAVERAIRIPARFLCTREIQKTIKESTHQLLVDTIERLGYSRYFDITENKIECVKNHSSFVFTGLRDLNVTNLKSIEGIDVCILNEAQNLTQKSWEVLDPTIRKPGSEIWIIYNDQAKIDFVYQFTVVNPPENMICEKVNYTDVPREWISQEIIDQAERMKKENPARYAHIWLGDPSEGGRFFVEFTPQIEEDPFVIPISASSGRLIGSLDSGTSHATSFGLWYIDDNLDVHRLMSVRTQGISIRASAEEIYDRLSSFPFTYSAFPDVIVYDNQMDTGPRLNDNDDRSPIDEYKDVFKRSNHLIVWEQANKRKENGCQILRMLFTGTTEMRPMRYFAGYNTTFIEGIQRVNTDENNAEVYEKAPGDDEADEARYGAVKVFSVRGVLEQRKKTTTPKTHLEELLSGRFKRKTETTQDWYNG